MKKTITFYFIAVLLIMVMCVTAGAVDFDYSGYSNEELNEAYAAITQELMSRDEEKTAHMKAGDYIGGVDIPVGEYLLVVDNTNGTVNGFLKFRSKTDFKASGSGTIECGTSFQKYFDIKENDTLTATIDFDLIIGRPRGIVIFE